MAIAPPCDQLRASFPDQTLRAILLSAGYLSVPFLEIPSSSYGKAMSRAYMSSMEWISSMIGEPSGVNPVKAL